MWAPELKEKPFDNQAGKLRLRELPLEECG
jgi:hypothetical protein